MVKAMDSSGISRSNSMQSPLNATIEVRSRHARTADSVQLYALTSINQSIQKVDLKIQRNLCLSFRSATTPQAAVLLFKMPLLQESCQSAAYRLTVDQQR